VKSISVGQQSALDSSHVTPVYFVQISFADDDVQYYCTAGASIAWNGYTWLGTGGLVAIEPIRETGAIEAVGLRLTMSGVPTGLISLALQGEIQGRAITFYLGLLDTAGALIGTPVTEYVGRLDTMTIVEGEQDATIIVTVESEMASLMSPAIRRYTDADQQKQYLGDKIFQYVAQMREKALPFPSLEAQRRG